jgi:hypothetical protein
MNLSTITKKVADLIVDKTARLQHLRDNLVVQQHLVALGGDPAVCAPIEARIEELEQYSLVELRVMHLDLVLAQTYAGVAEALKQSPTSSTTDHLIAAVSRVLVNTSFGQGQITAAELRAAGWSVPDEIPNVATIQASGVRMLVERAQPATTGLAITIGLSCTAPFTWHNTTAYLNKPIRIDHE